MMKTDPALLAILGFLVVIGVVCTVATIVTLGASLGIWGR